MPNIEKYIPVIALVVGIIALTLIIWLFIKVGTVNKQVSNQGEKMSASQLTTAKVESSCPGPIELPCRQGPIGDMGPSGGTFFRNGPLRNLGQTDMVVDRMFNTGPASVAYLSNPNYKSQQTWTLHSGDGTLSNRLENQYGGCLTYDDQDTVYISPCKGSSQWIFTAQGLLKPKSGGEGKSKCLSFSNQGLLKNVEKTGLVNTGGKNLNPYTKLLQLKMVPCDGKADNQQWSFY